jgi:putative transposase
MSAYHRPHIPGATIFFTVALAERGSDLLVREIEALRESVRYTRTERPFDIDAWVVLPDHLHCVWTMPEGDADYSTRWGAIKARFTRGIRDECRVGFHPTNAKSAGLPVGWNPTLRRSASKIRKGDAGIWQRRYWEHHIRDDADLTAHLHYCWLNPVKHGPVERPEDWPHTSLHRDARYVPGMDITP